MALTRVKIKPFLVAVDKSESTFDMELEAQYSSYPLEGAWRRALEACRDFLGENQGYELAITFAILDQSILEVGQRILKEVIPE